MNQKTTNQFISLASRLAKYAIRNSFSIGHTEIKPQESTMLVKIYLAERTDDRWSISFQNRITYESIEVAGYSKKFNYDWNLTQKDFDEMIVQLIEITAKLESEEDGQDEVLIQYNTIKSQIQDLQNELSEISKKLI
jgi:exonuclease VII small subunit